jgi:hypothetical protein
MIAWQFADLLESSAYAAGQFAFKGEKIFNRIRDKAVAAKWGTLPINEVMGKVAQELLGIPYKGGTLDLSLDQEIPSVDFTGLDCVTFVEITLAFARILKMGRSTAQDLLREIAFIRYRKGTPGDYATRLHYTSDWFYDNAQKGIIELLDNFPGLETFRNKVGFMSGHPDSYGQLKAHPDLIPEIRQQEESINSRALKFMPMAKLASIEHLLRTGDIIGVCADIPGLDIAHMGLVYRAEDGIPHFMDASSLKRNMRVTIEPGPIHKALSWSNTLTGVMIARPSTTAN